MLRWLLPVLLLAACAEEDTDDLCSREVPLTYESWGQGFVSTHCNGCHSSIIAPAQRRNAPVGIDFDTYEGVLRFAERVEARTIEAASDDDETTTPMPPGGGPTAEELQMLHEWMTCRVYPDKARLEAQ